MDIGKNIQLSFELYFKNFVLLVLASLVVLGLYFLATIAGIILSILGILVGLVFLVLAGPLLAGLIMLCLKLLRGQAVELNEVLAHFNQLVPTLQVVLMMVAATLVLTVIACIPLLGVLIALVIGPILGFIFFMALALIADKGLGSVQAVKKALDYFMTNPVMIWLYILILALIAIIVYAIPMAIISGILLAAPKLAMALLLLFGFALSALVWPFVTLGMAAAYQELTAKEPVAQVKLDPQTLKIGGIVLAVLFALGLLFMFFWGSFLFPLGPLGINRFGPSSPNQISINTNEGSVRVGTGLPRNFPKDIPLYPGAKAQSSGSWGEGNSSGQVASVSLITNASPEKVTQFYLTQMQNKGWQVQTGQINNINMLNCTKEKRTASVTVLPGEKETTIQVTYSNE